MENLDKIVVVLFNLGGIENSDDLAADSTGGQGAAVLSSLLGQHTSKHRHGQGHQLGHAVSTGVGANRGAEISLKEGNDVINLGITLDDLGDKDNRGGALITGGLSQDTLDLAHTKLSTHSSGVQEHRVHGKTNLGPVHVHVGLTVCGVGLGGAEGGGQDGSLLSQAGLTLQVVGHGTAKNKAVITSDISPDGGHKAGEDDGKGLHGADR